VLGCQTGHELVVEPVHTSCDRVPEEQDLTWGEPEQLGNLNPMHGFM
jgi:hypothetical protein